MGPARSHAVLLVGVIKIGIGFEKMVFQRCYDTTLPFCDRNMRSENHLSVLTNHYIRSIQPGDPLGFFNIHSVAKHQKIEG